MLTASERYPVVLPYRTLGRSRRWLVLGGVIAVGVPVGGALDVQLTNRFLVQIIQAGTRASFVGDASTAYHYLDLFFVHTLAYCALVLAVCSTGLLSLALRPLASATDRPNAAAWAGQHGRFPFALTAAMVFMASVLGGGLLDRAMIKWRFAHEGIASHVSTDAVLHPFYAYDALYQRLTLLTVVALLVYWLVGQGLQRHRSH